MKEKASAIITTKHYMAIMLISTIIMIMSTRFQIVLFKEEISWKTFMPFIIIYATTIVEWILNPIQKLIKKYM